MFDSYDDWGVAHGHTASWSACEQELVKADELEEQLSAAAESGDLDAFRRLGKLGLDSQDCIAAFDKKASCAPPTLGARR